MVMKDGEFNYLWIKLFLMEFVARKVEEDVIIKFRITASITKVAFFLGVHKARIFSDPVIPEHAAFRITTFLYIQGLIKKYLNCCLNNKAKACTVKPVGTD